MIAFRCRLTITLPAVALAAALHAQIVVPGKGETIPTFEVSTVRPTSPNLDRRFHGASIRWRTSSFSTENVMLRSIIASAWNLASHDQLTGGPDDLLSARWDINAKISDDDYARLQQLPHDDRQRMLRLMVQRLVADRFGLKVHIETRELPVFDLVADKGGAKLQPTAPDSPTPPSDPQASPGSPAKPRPQGISADIERDEGKVTATAATLADLANLLDHQPELDGRIVIDKTGLTGKYDFTLDWHPTTMSATALDTDATGPNLFGALKDQLGLKLESSKGPVQIVVIDAVSSPTPN